MKKLGKKEKRKIDDVIVYTASIVMVAVMTVLVANVVTELLVETNYNKNKITNYTRKETIVEEAIKAVEEKEFCTVLVEASDNIPYESEGNEYTGHVTTYTYKTNKDKSKVMYSYVDQNSTNSTLLEFWNPNENNEYDIYIWSSEVDSYVKTSNDSEPVTISTWDVLNNMEDYEVVDSGGEWGEQKEPCYILAIYGKNDIYDTIGQYMYISKKSLLPVGVITAAANYDDEDITIAKDGSVNINATVTDGDIEEHTESIVRMSYAWTTIDSIDLPTEYMTEDEFYSKLDSAK